MPGRPGGRFGKSFYQKLDDAGRTAYKAYLDGTRTHTVQRKISGEERALIPVSVVPFGITPAAAAAADDEKYRTQATVQALKIGKLIQASLVVFGLEDQAATDNDGLGFYPALAKPSIREETATPSSRTSTFSDRTYDLYPNRSGSIPFGRLVAAATTGDYEARLKEITTEWQGATLTGLKKVSVSFSPEYWDNPPASASGSIADATGSIVF
ncbi:MAG: hypothetical protein AAFO04_24030 [Cyanobacteria bacterium J06592_8]